MRTAKEMATVADQSLDLTLVYMLSAPELAL